MIAAANKPITRCRKSKLNGEIKSRAIRTATSTASPALHAAKTTALEMLRSPNKFAAIVPAIVPTTTGIRATDPILISTPAAIPAAGQKTATPSGFVRRARPSRAAQEIGNTDRNGEPNGKSPRVRPPEGGHTLNDFARSQRAEHERICLAALSHLNFLAARPRLG